MSEAEWAALTVPRQSEHDVLAFGCGTSEGLDPSYRVLPPVECDLTLLVLDGYRVRWCHLEPYCTRHEECNARPRGVCRGQFSLSWCDYPADVDAPCTTDDDCRARPGGQCSPRGRPGRVLLLSGWQGVSCGARARVALIPTNRATPTSTAARRLEASASSGSGSRVASTMSAGPTRTVAPVEAANASRARGDAIVCPRTARPIQAAAPGKPAAAIGAAAAESSAGSARPPTTPASPVTLSRATSARSPTVPGTATPRRALAASDRDAAGHRFGSALRRSRASSATLTERVMARSRHGAGHSGPIIGSHRPRNEM